MAHRPWFRHSVIFRWLVLTGLLAGGLPAASPAQTPTLEAILSAPHRSGLVASPTGSQLAWVENRSGVRNIFVAEAPNFQSRQITGYERDSGTTLSDLSFSPDGATLVYTRSGGKNRYGEYPNPTSDPDGVSREMWTIPFAGGEPRRLGEGSNPMISPSGDRVVFGRDGEAYVVPMNGSEESRQLFEARGSVSGLRWSPEGGLLAFVSGRGDHSFIGVYDFARDSLWWVAPSVDRDRNPRWSPDGSRLAFYRFFGPGRDVAETTFGPVSEPYAVWVADPATGEAREVWRSPAEENQGYPSVSGSHDLMWAAGDRLVFPAELDGWLHMYAVPITGGNAVDLIPGNCIVEDATLSPDREWLYYNHNCGDIDRRDLARVRVTGGEPEPLTSSDAIEWSPVVTGNGRTLAFIRSDARHPGAVYRISAAGGDPQAVSDVVPNDFPVQTLVEPERVVFPAEDGLEIHGQIFRPPGLDAGDERPAVIFLHGGSRRQMLPGWHYSGYYHNAYAFNQYLATQGYVVLSVNYRSGIGYGKAFRQPPNYGWQGAAEYKDVLAARHYLADLPYVDSTSIGLWGGSYGGYLTALGLARDSDLFAAGVDLHGVHDWVTTLQFWGSDLFDYDAHTPDRADSLAALAFASSPNASVDDWRSPVLLVHGDDDRNVDFYETVELVRLLRENGNVEFETLVFPDDVHGFLLHRNWLQTFRAASEFFDRHLKE